ncbi:heparan-alpha-glucosaminide N-acetyltransferase-like [Arapaima gigas]
MVFANYEGGGYWFFLHIPWNGLAVGDCVMPWFVFIMGTSIVLAFNVMWRKGVGRRQLLRKVTWRSVVLFLIGICFINYNPTNGLCMYMLQTIIFRCSSFYPGFLHKLSYLVLPVSKKC